MSSNMLIVNFLRDCICHVLECLSMVDDDDDVLTFARCSADTGLEDGGGLMTVKVLGSRLGSVHAYSLRHQVFLIMTHGTMERDPCDPCHDDIIGTRHDDVMCDDR